MGWYILQYSQIFQREYRFYGFPRQGISSEYLKKKSMKCEKYNRKLICGRRWLIANTNLDHIFIEAQVYTLEKNVLYQDNKSTIILEKM